MQDRDTRDGIDCASPLSPGPPDREQCALVMGISEGIVLADRYRLTRRLSERETGASWVAVDLETGSDVWVQFASHGGLAPAADLVRDLATATQTSSSHASALPTVLDTGELRMIVDSRALAALRGGAEAHATHVEIVIEFAVVKPLTGRGLPAKILRRALPPAEALGIAATVAGALDALLAAGGSHGWIGPGSIWMVRRGGCLLDAALGLAYPDGSPIEIEQQVTGYFAPERLAIGGKNAAVGSGSAATQAADVFALGWMLYEMLIGHAELQAEYERLVAGAGAVTTVELLTLWRARARVHVAELLAVDSALAVLVLECLAENPAQRPGFAAFAERARGAAKAMAGAAALVVPVARGRAGAAVAAELPAAETLEVGALAVAELESSGTAGASMTGADAGAGLSGESGAVEAAGAASMEAETAVLAAAGDAGILAAAAFGAEALGGSVGTADVGVGEAEAAMSAQVAEGSGVSQASEISDVSGTSGESGHTGQSGASAAGAGSGAAASGTLGTVGTVGTLGATAVGAEAVPASGAEVSVVAEAERELARASHRARLATIGGTAAAVVALGVGVAIGYGVGHGGTTSTVLTAAGANVAAPLASASSTGGAGVVPAPTVTVTVTVTASPAAGAASPVASASPAGSTSANTGTNSSPSEAASPALPAPTSAAEAITELNQEIEYALGSGQVSQDTAQRLTTAVATLQSSLGTRSYSNSLSSLTSLIRSLEGSGRLPSDTELALESILGYFYAGSGS